MKDKRILEGRETEMKVGEQRGCGMTKREQRREGKKQPSICHSANLKRKKHTHKKKQPVTIPTC